MSKKLVAYFSASGQTQTAATKISKLLNSDLYEIKPKKNILRKTLISMIQIQGQLQNVKIEPFGLN